jgi:hypothetical protein
LPRLASRIGPDTQVTVIGREDPTLKEDLAQERAAALRKALIAEGVPAANIRTQVGVVTGDAVNSGGKPLWASTIRWTTSQQVEAPAQRYAQQAVAALQQVDLPPATAPKFEFRAEDGTIGAALQRWAKASGYELVWDAMDVGLTGSSTVQAPDFVAAVQRVVADLQKLNYPLRPQLFTDRVVRIYSKN